MLKRTKLSEEQARFAMEHGEFGEDVRNADENVAVVMTQGWCPQWTSMNVWLGFMKRRGKPKDLEITVLEFIYDKVDFFPQFMSFKENHFGNYEIPYIRYYKHGKPVSESNYTTSGDFLARFEEAGVAG
ncbi:MAG: hypothetical protein GVY23_05090 [Spirochaetes bacterium]|jgi:hypothetical protein|nr:hypothetical protein [Spirochaetota bacterium]